MSSKMYWSILLATICVGLATETLALKEFNETCTRTSECNTTKNLECTTKRVCKCKFFPNHYLYGGNCVRTYEKIRVTNAVASPLSTTEIQINWTPPEHAASVNRIEITMSPTNLQPPVQIYNVAAVSSATIKKLQPGTKYLIGLASVDSTSMAVQTTRSVSVKATTYEAFDGVCSDTIICYSAVNLVCTSGYCKCKSGHYYYGGSCLSTLDNLKVRNLAATAGSQVQVRVSWVSPLHGTAVNAFEVTWVPTHGGSQPRTFSGSATNTTVTGFQSETEYTITVTSEDTTSGSSPILTSTSVSVKTKSALGGSCTDVNNCDGTYVECHINKCQCQVNYYDTNNAAAGGTCKPISELKVTDVNVAVISTTSVSVMWVNPVVAAVIESKQIRWSGRETGSKNVQNSDTSADITGLTPGGTYNIQVVSIDTNSRTSSQEVVSSVQVTTKPAVPGNIESIVPDNTGTKVTLSWRASVGVVTGYEVVFEGETGHTHTQATKTNSITIMSLRPGTRYNITVTAVSGSMKSDPVYGTIRTTVLPPGPPTNLQCGTITDTNVTVTWTPPTNPNGDIMYYLINVKSGPGSPRTINTTTSVTTEEIPYLTEDQSYTFTIVTVNDRYNGSESTPVTCNTTAGLPSEPDSLIFTQVNGRSFTIWWMKPKEIKGHLTGYRVLVQNGTKCSKEILFQCISCPIKPAHRSDCPVDAKHIVSMTDTELNKLTFVHKVEDLQPYVQYEVSVNAISGAGDGDRKSFTINTAEEVPQNVTEVKADVLNSTAINITWSIPNPRPGVTTYTINVMDDINGRITLNKSVFVEGFYERMKVLADLEEYWQYVIRIKAMTSKGETPMISVTPNRTLPAAPGKVANFKISRPEGDYKTATVTWSIPSLRDQNSLIKSYEFKHNATGILASKKVAHLANSNQFTEFIQVHPETFYYVEVYAINDQNQTGIKSSELYYAPPGPPPKLDASQGGIKIVQKDETLPVTETTVTIVVYEKQFTADGNGKVVSSGIILCPKAFAVTTERQHIDYETFYTWKQAKKGGFKQCYRTTNSSWLNNPKQVTLRKRSTHERISYTIGDDTACDQKPDNEHCNGPLNPGTTYMIFTFVCTAGGCTESQPIYVNTVEIATNDLPYVAIIVGIAGALVIISIVVIVFIIVKKRKTATSRKDADFTDFELNTCVLQRERAMNTNKAYSSLCEQNKLSRNRPIQLSNITKTLAKMHKDSDLIFEREFQDLEILSPKGQCKHAMMIINKRRNRDENILPFDSSRVILTDDKNDYINASMIQSYKNKTAQEFIATQHPLPYTVEDFWMMIWEQNVSVIVMLTPEINEHGLIYDRYFPRDLQASKQYGSIGVEYMAKLVVQTTEYSSIKMNKGKKSRMLKHFHCLDWNDSYGDAMKRQVLHLLETVRSNTNLSDNLGPTVVHCSLGTGRTGVFIALYQLMDHMHEDSVDIFDLVLTLRESRMQIVENKLQYMFIHDCFLYMMNQQDLKGHVVQDRTT